MDFDNYDEYIRNQMKREERSIKLHLMTDAVMAIATACAVYIAHLLPHPSIIFKLIMIAMLAVLVVVDAKIISHKKAAIRELASRLGGC